MEKAIDIEETYCSGNETNDQHKDRTNILSELYYQFSKKDFKTVDDLYEHDGKHHVDPVSGRYYKYYYCEQTI